MSQFKSGDRAIIQGEIAVIDVFDPESNLIVYITEIGGAENRTTAHISNTRVVALDGSFATGGEGPKDIFGDPLEQEKMGAGTPNLINEDGTLNEDAVLG